MTINARVLPTVWYSKLDPVEGDSVRIFGTIQNDSGVEFKGLATFYVRGKNVGQSEFVSTSGRLTVVSTSWKAEIGNNSVELGIETDLPEDMELASDRSGESVLHVNKVITSEVIKADAQQAVETVKGKGDSVAESIIERLEEIKEKPLVFGPASTTESWSKKLTSSTVSKAYEGGIEVAQFAVAHWVWSLSGILIFFLLWRVWRKKRYNDEY